MLRVVSTENHKIVAHTILEQKAKRRIGEASFRGEATCYNPSTREVRMSSCAGSTLH